MTAPTKANKPTRGFVHMPHCLKRSRSYFGNEAVDKLVFVVIDEVPHFLSAMFHQLEQLLLGRLSHPGSLAARSQDLLASTTVYGENKQIPRTDAHPQSKGYACFKLAKLEGLLLSGRPSNLMM